MTAAYNGQFTVEFGATSSTISNNVTASVTNVSVTVGRRRITDRWTPNVAVVELYAPPNSGYTIPTLGYYGKLSVTGGAMFYGRVTDVARVFDMPYNSGTGDAPGDRVTVRLESIAGYALGRGYATVASLGFSIKDACNVVFNDGIGGTGGIDFYGTAWDSFDAQIETYTGNTFDYFNSALISTQGYYLDYRNVVEPDFYQNGYRAASTYVNFTDVPGAQTNALYYYDQLEFLSTIDNSYTRIDVAYNNGASTATATSGSAPFTAYNTTTVLEDLSDAQQVADVMLAILSQSAYRPFRISTRSRMWPSVTGIGYYEALYRLVGTACAITFRGTTYNTIIEGFDVTQDQEDARWTFYLSPALNVPLILDATNFGILNTNTLGLG